MLLLLSWTALGAVPEELEERMPLARTQLETCARSGCEDSEAAEAAWVVAMHTYLDAGVADGTLSATVKALDPDLFQDLPAVIRIAATEPYSWVKSASTPEVEPAPAEETPTVKDPFATAPAEQTGEVHMRGPRAFQLTIRGGGSKYYDFDFVTAGVEVGVPLRFVSNGLMLVAGIETYRVRRELPMGRGKSWRDVKPMNLGAVYRFDASSRWIPYLGADVITAQYYQDAVGTDWTVGARARGGLDVMLTKNFGLNTNAALGFWTGENWILIEPTMQKSGLLPQINAGVLLAL